MKKAEEILKAVAEVYGISVMDIKGKVRKRTFAEARQVSRYFIMKILRLSSRKIGEITNCDHSTILYSVKVVSDLKETNRSFRKRFNEIKEDITMKINESLID